MIRICWAAIIRAPWSSLLWVLLAPSLFGADTLQHLVQTYRKTPNAETKTAVLQYAKAHEGGLALLALAATETELKQFPEALEHLKAIQKRLPVLQDYVWYLTAASQFELRDYEATIGTARAVVESKPGS